MPAPLQPGEHGNTYAKKTPAGWQYRARVVDWGGRATWATGTGPTQAAARTRFEASLARKLARGQDASTMTVNDLVDSWLEHLDRKVADNRLKRTSVTLYRNAYETTLEPEIGDVLVPNLTERLCRDVLDDLQAGRRRGVDRTGQPRRGRPVTGDQPRAVLALLTAYAHERRWLPVNPMSGLTKPVSTRRKAPQLGHVDTTREVHRHLTTAEVADLDRILAARERAEDGRPGPKSGTTLRDAVHLMLRAGLRIGEACALRWCDVAWTGDTITYRTQGEHQTTIVTAPVVVMVRGTYIEPRDGNRYEIGSPKAASSIRDVPADQVLADLLTTRRNQARHTNPTDFVLATRTGTPTRPTNLRSALRRLVADHPTLAGITPHDLRRTYGEAIRARHGLQAAQIALGHSRIETTRDSYTDDAVVQVTTLPGELGAKPSDTP